MQLPTTEYRLKESYRRPEEYLGGLKRHEGIEVDAAYFKRLHEVNHNQIATHTALNGTRATAGAELAPYLQEMPKPITYKPSPLRFSA